MKKILHTSALAALFACTPLFAHDNTNAAPDLAAQLLARHGHVTVRHAGAFVEAGTYRIQVAAKLGQPDARLADGTWLYQNRKVTGSDAEGTLVVRFSNGRVTSLALATPAVVAAWKKEAAKPSPELLARK